MMTEICGIIDRVFWVAEYNEYELITLHKMPAYGEDGEFTLEVDKIVGAKATLYFGTPMDAICDIKSNERIDRYLTFEKQEELSNLFKK